MGDGHRRLGEDSIMRLDALRLGLAAGAVWAAGVAFLAGWARLLGMGGPAVEVIGSLYVGYAATAAGAVIGALWGFVDGFIGGWLVGLVYNALLPRRAR